MSNSNIKVIAIIASIVLVFTLVCMGDMYYKASLTEGMQSNVRELVLVNYENKILNLNQFNLNNSYFDFKPSETA